MKKEQDVSRNPLVCRLFSVCAGHRTTAGVWLFAGALLLSGGLAAVQGLAPAGNNTWSVQPVTLSDMVMALERAQAERDGALFPGIEPITRDFGLRILSDALPADFIAGLSGAVKRGVTVYPVTVQTDDTDGATVFRNADGEVFYAVGGGSPGWDPAWIADLYGVAGFRDFEQTLARMIASRLARGIPTNNVYMSAFMSAEQSYRPSHLIHAYTLIAGADADAYLNAPQLQAAPMSLMSAGAAPPPPLTNLAFTAFSSDSNGVYIAMEWPQDIELAGNALDLFHTHRLTSPNWANVFRYEDIPLGVNTFSDFIPHGALPPFPDTNAVITVVTNIAGGVTNIVPSQFDPTVLYTNIIPEVVTNWPSQSAFFRAADTHDTDMDGLSDATEKWVTGTNPESDDTDGDGIFDGGELTAGLDPLNPDTDGDGILDADEMGYVREVPFRWYDTSNGVNLLAGSTGTLGYGMWTLPLLSPIAVDTSICTNIILNVFGSVFLPCNSNAPLPSNNYGNGQSLAMPTGNEGHIRIAAYWGRLLARFNREPKTEIRVAEIPEIDSMVIEYRNMGFDDSSRTNESVTFQVVLPHAQSNTVYINYLDASTFMRGTYATLGIQNATRRMHENTNHYYHIHWSTNTSYYIPIETIIPPMSLEYHIGCGTHPVNRDTDGDGLSDGEEVYTWQTDPLHPDTDRDGLPDGLEVELGLDPCSVDSDSDGMPDGWEHTHQLAPTDPADAWQDADSDGLPNLAEFRAGTNPRLADTDDDHVSDGNEAAWWESVPLIPWFDVFGGMPLLHNTNLNSGLISSPLPFPVRVAGWDCTNALIDINGIVYLIDRLKPVDNKIYNHDTNADLALRSSLTDNHLAIAAHWDDLYARTAHPATSIIVADVTTNDARFCVIEYRDMGFWSNAVPRVSFQVVIPQDGANTVYVRYPDTDAANGGSATLGAQGLGAAINLPVSFNRPFIMDGLTLAYHFGSGGSPLVKDTDGDGLDDREELVLGTSPANPDSDGDGLPDDWEAKNGLNPLSASGDEGADGDPDGDHLSNLAEHKAGTKPSIPDTDNDGLTDGEELGWFDITHGQTFRFDTSGGINLLSPATTTYDSDTFPVPLPFPVRLAGVTYSNALISVEGAIGLQNPAYPYSYTIGSGNENLSSSSIHQYHAFICAYWDDLFANPASLGSQITLADVTTNGTRYCVIEYRDFQIRNGTANDLASFQIAIPQNASDSVSVHYLDMRGTADGRGATLGAQTGNRKRNLPVAYNIQGSVVSGDVITYHFSTGTDPLVWDTDGDGMPDGWEACYGLDPLNPSDASLDPDWDGVPNLSEYLSDTDPKDMDNDRDGLSNFFETFFGTDLNNSDTDNDGISDGDEIFVFGTNPLDPSDGFPDSDDDGILDAIEETLGTSSSVHDSMADSDGDGILDLLDEAPANPSIPAQGAIAFSFTHPAQGGSLP